MQNKISGEQFRIQREATGMKNLSAFATIAGVNVASLCKYERGLYQFSDRSLQLILGTLDDIRAIARRHRGVPINFTDLRWVRAQIAEGRSRSRPRSRSHAPATRQSAASA